MTKAATETDDSAHEALAKRGLTIGSLKAGAEALSRIGLSLDKLAMKDQAKIAAAVEAAFSAGATNPLAELGKTILEINQRNGWNVVTPEDWPAQDEADPLKRYRIPASIALAHSELSEALEAFRKLDRENFAEELADVLIRLLDLACGLGIDIDAEVAKKLEKNRGRGFRHGGKVV